MLVKSTNDWQTFSYKEKQLTHREGKRLTIYQLLELFNNSTCVTLIAIQNNIWHRSRKGKLSRRIVCARLFPVANCYHITNPISYSFWARSYLIFSYLLCVYRCHGLTSGQWDVGRSESCLFQAWPLQLSHLQHSMFFLLLTEWR